MNEIMDAITKYKESCAFLTAIKLGLFDDLLKTPLSIEHLAKEKAIDFQLLRVLLVYFQFKGLLQEERGIWKLTKPFKESYVKINHNILFHELNLYQKWITPDVITNSLAKGVGKRDFDIKGFDREECQIYSKAMYEDTVEYLTFWIKRMVKLGDAPTVLEIGRSPGVIGVELKKTIPNAQIDVAVDKAFYAICKAKFHHVKGRVKLIEQFQFSKMYDLICIFNTIHYLTHKELSIWIEKIKTSMHKKSVICMIDIFLDEKHQSLEPHFMIDWLTHGGIFHLNVEEIKNIMEEHGLIHLKTKQIHELSFDLLFFKTG